MKFTSETVEDFKNLFDQHKEKIRHFEGCKRLELYQDQNNPTLFFTYSYWESESHLNAYRHSDLFAKVWKTTKAMFSEKAEAWSLNQLVELD